jgi:hypothetical protein
MRARLSHFFHARGISAGALSVDNAICTLLVAYRGQIDLVARSYPLGTAVLRFGGSQ